MSIFKIDTDTVSNYSEEINTYAKELSNISSIVASYNTNTDEGDFDFQSAKNVISQNIEACSNKFINTSKLIQTVVNAHINLQTSIKFEKEEKSSEGQNNTTKENYSNNKNNHNGYVHSNHHSSNHSSNHSSHHNSSSYSNIPYLSTEKIDSSTSSNIQNNISSSEVSKNDIATIDEARAYIVKLAVGEDGSKNGKKYMGIFKNWNDDTWCSEFVAWTLKTAGMPEELWKKFKGSVGALSYMEKLGLVSKTPHVGDIVFFKTNKSGRKTDHIGIVTKINSDGSFETIEGGTSVKKRTRKMSEVYGFGSPDYSKMINVSEKSVKASNWTKNLINNSSQKNNFIKQIQSTTENKDLLLVKNAYNTSGISIDTANTTDPATVLKNAGFKEVTTQVNLTTGEGIKRGDILMNSTSEQTHLEIATSSSNIVGITSDSSTNIDIKSKKYQNLNWTKVLRLTK